MSDNIEGKLISTGGRWLPGPATRLGEEELRYTNGSDTAEAYWHRTEIGSNYCPESSLIAGGAHLIEEGDA